MTIPQISISLFSFCIFSIQSVSIVVAAEDTTAPKPVGWAEMDEGKKSQYLALWEAYSADMAELKLSSKEREAMSNPEQKAFKQAIWEIRADFMGKLAGEGFEIESVYQNELAKTVEKAAAADGKAGKTPEKVAASVNGTITYDDGVGGTTFGNGSIIGNRFDTFGGGNPIGSSGTIDTVQAVVVALPGNTTDSAGFVIEGPQTVGGGAFAIFSTFTTGLTAATETVTYSGLGVNYTGSSFFVLFGDFNSVYVPAFGTGTTNGQGFHGVNGLTGGMGPNITATSNLGGNLNALIRVTGNVLTPIPVELMKFEVESEKPVK